jgi:hypothetical protein
MHLALLWLAALKREKVSECSAQFPGPWYEAIHLNTCEVPKIDSPLVNGNKHGHHGYLNSL